MTVNAITPIVAELAPLPSLTPKQAALFRYLCYYLELYQCLPTFREICRHFGWHSTQAVTNYFRCLERKGFLVLVSGIPGKSVGSYRLCGLRLRLVPEDSAVGRRAEAVRQGKGT
jgi:SOS-response transcriptional repressor LexA